MAKAKAPLNGCDGTATCERTARPKKVNSPQLKVVIVGHVDHGKSTLVGRLLYETGTLPEAKWLQLQHAAQSRQMPFEWANLVDALQIERNQNITIDTTQIRLRTASREYILIDAPGHRELLKNMVTGAAQADAALLLIDASEGIREESRRHAFLLHLLGILQLTVVVNKMDLKDYSQACFRQIEHDYVPFLKGVGLESHCFIPVSARCGDNLATRSPNMPWWSGLTVLEALEQFRLPPPRDSQPLRFSVQDVYRFDHRRIVAGRVESGTLKVGDRLAFSPGAKVSAVRSIERWHAPESTSATAGQSIGITLSDPILVQRGYVASLESSPPYELPRFKTRLFWMGSAPLCPGKTYKLRLSTQEVDCRVDMLIKVMDGATLETISRPGPDAFVQRHEVAELYLRTARPLLFDAYSEMVPTGRFVLQDGAYIAGGGIILDDDYPRRSLGSAHKSTHIYWRAGSVTLQERQARRAQKGCILWLTGLPSSGKTTIANELERRLFARGLDVYVLDGDKLRHGLCSDLGFSLKDRKENIRRAGEVAKLFADAGFICITAFISPYRTDRAMVRGLVNEGQFIEVYVNAPLEVCEQRDPKGLYPKARAGEIKNFTGISAPYEAPTHPEIELRTDQLSVAETVEKVLTRLHALNVLRD